MQRVTSTSEFHWDPENGSAINEPTVNLLQTARFLTQKKEHIFVQSTAEDRYSYHKSTHPVF